MRERVVDISPRLNQIQNTFIAAFKVAAAAVFHRQRVLDDIRLDSTHRRSQ